MPPQPTCSIPDCNDLTAARGWCVKHYWRWRRHGDPLSGGPPQPHGATAVERFWAKVDRSGGADACWPWSGGRNADGYGRFKIEGRTVLPHRVAYELDRGHPPPSERPQVLHHCDNPPCCNARHLFSGTRFDNMADARMKKRLAIGERHGRAKLTDSRVREIRQRVAAGESQRTIAQSLHVSSSTVWRAARSKNWLHVGS